jgi:hypothetical protein
MSAYSEDYRELIEGARDAVHELLRGSTPDSWMGLRNHYTALRKAVEHDDRDRQQEEEQEEKDRQRRKLEEIHERRNVWGGCKGNGGKAFCFRCSAMSG